MPTFEVLFELSPPGAFGLPGESRIVLPTPIENAYGPTLDTRTKQLVSHGTLSVYRSEGNRFSVEEKSQDYEIKAYDNFFCVKVKAESDRTAIEMARNLTEAILLRWAVYSGGTRFTARTVQMTDAEGKVYPISRTMVLLSIRSYDLSSLKGNLVDAVKGASLQDERLVRALAYFDRFLLLQEMASNSSYLDPFAREAGYLASEMMLNLYKSITSILGDPTIDSDYQSRFKMIGLKDGFWEDRVKPIKRIRDDLDVAHYTIKDATQELRQKISEASQTCQEVIKAYMAWL